MIKKGNKYNRCIYAWIFEDKFIYVGLTSDLEKRKNEHLTDKRSEVYKHLQICSIVTCKQLTDYIDIENAIKLENFYEEKYRNENYIILNKAKTGALGGSDIVWTYEKCKEEALKYDNKTDFIKNSGSAYNSAKKYNIINKICSHMTTNNLNPKDFWTYERCKDEFLKFDKNIKDFRLKGKGAYWSCLRNKWLNKLYSECNVVK